MQQRKRQMLRPDVAVPQLFCLLPCLTQKLQRPLRQVRFPHPASPPFLRDCRPAFFLLYRSREKNNFSSTAQN